MLVAGSNRRVHVVDAHAGVAFTGNAADGRQIVNRSREECVSYEDTYGIKIPSNVLSDRVSSYVHYFSLHGALRPFGASALIASYDQDVKKFSLHTVDPSGMAYAFYANAVGKGRQGAKTELEKIDFEAITVEEGVKEIARIIDTLHDDDKDKPYELELSWISEATGFVFQACSKEVVAAAQKYAKEQNAEEEDDEDDEMEA